MAATFPTVVVAVVCPLCDAITAAPAAAAASAAASAPKPMDAAWDRKDPLALLPALLGGEPFFSFLLSMIL